MRNTWLTRIIRSPTEHLNFLFDTINKTLDKMGIPDPNKPSLEEEPNEPTSEDDSDGSETDPLLPRSRRSDNSSDDGMSEGCVAFSYGLFRSYWNFQRWNYSSL